MNDLFQNRKRSVTTLLRISMKDFRKDIVKVIVVGIQEASKLENFQEFLWGMIKNPGGSIP